MKNITDLLRIYRPVTHLQKLQMVVSSAVGSVTDYSNASHYSRLTDLTGVAALTKIRQRMLESPEGSRILGEKPRITTSTLNMAAECSQATLGKAYHSFMSRNGFVPEQRPLANHIADVELAYVCQRYKEVHDFIHVLFVSQVDVEGELLVKWFEMVQLGLPSATLAALVSPMMRPHVTLERIASVCEQARQYPLIMNIEFQKHFRTNLEQLKQGLLSQRSP